MKFNIYKLATSESSFEEKIIDFHTLLGIRHDEECINLNSSESRHYDDDNLVCGIDKYTKKEIPNGEDPEKEILIWSALVNRTSPGDPLWGSDFFSLSDVPRESINFEKKNTTSGLIYLRFINRVNANFPASEESADCSLFINNYNLEKYFINYNESDFLITWGEAWRVTGDIRVEDFGLKVVANLIHKDELLHLAAKEISLNGRLVSSRIYRPGEFTQFKIDSDSELTNKISGEFKVRDELFSSSQLNKIKLSGASGITFGSSKYCPNIEDLISDISLLNNYYYRDDYKSEHEYLDSLESIPKGSQLYEDIILEIIRGLNSGTQEYILDLEDADTLEEENYILNIGVSSIEEFFQVRHLYYDTQADEHSVKVSSILRAEVQISSNTYIYFCGDIYRVPQGAVEILDRSLEEIKYIDGLLGKDWDSSVDERELDYNQSIPSIQNKFLSLDQVLYKPDRNETAYEICDLFSADGYMIHVKKDAGSSKGPANISHLCAQAYNSTFSMLNDGNISDDYELIFATGNIASQTLNNEVTSGSMRNIRGNLNSYSGLIKKENFKTVLCLALDVNGFSDSRTNILSMSYLRKITINNLKNNLKNKGMELYLTTIKYR
ncbi:DUF6119 family protein [Rothia nasimurium]|uniref:DUF6119 family protein n=1 Tax=Rothia nasimurium TaxID=85336 RepID=UPI001F30C81D|nr:DUF6119 family protein [Rothia nasimurium]